MSLICILSYSITLALLDLFISHHSRIIFHLVLKRRERMGKRWRYGWGKEEQFVEMTFSLCLGFQMVLRKVVLDRVGRYERYQYFKRLAMSFMEQ